MGEEESNVIDSKEKEKQDADPKETKSRAGNSEITSVDELLQFCTSTEKLKHYQGVSSSRSAGSSMGSLKLTAFPTFKHVPRPSNDASYRINTKKYVSPLLIFRSYRYISLPLSVSLSLCLFLFIFCIWYSFCLLIFFIPFSFLIISLSLSQ